MDIVEHAITESEVPARRDVESAPVIAGREGPVVDSGAVRKNEERWIIDQNEILEVVTPGGSRRWCSQTGHC